MTEATGKSPVRIELATSEIESGSCRAWADPVQVLASVAISVPDDSFGTYVEPRLQDLAGTSLDGSKDGLPALVRELVDNLQQVHSRLYRDNGAGLEGTPRNVRMTCAVGEEDRLYFVKAASTWIGLLRDGVARPVEEVDDAETGHPGLGKEERLGLDVTSLPVEPGDVVVMLAAEGDSVPDLRAVASVFAQTHDLKRACDGLVNLIGLQSEGAAAVAFRFVPVGSHPQPSASDDQISNLASEYEASGPVPAGAPEGATKTASTIASGAESFLDSLGDPSSDSASFSRDVGSKPESSLAARETAPTASLFSQSGDGEAGQGAETAEPELEFAGVGSASDSGSGTGGVKSVDREYHRGRNILWPLLVAIIVGAILGLAAFPGGGLKSFFEGESEAEAPTGPTGELILEPDPPARAIFIDGEEVAQGSPAHFPQMAVGTHVVRFDLGVCGSWESEVEVVEGQSVRFAPPIRGSVSVTAADNSQKGLIWVEGGEKVSLPAELNDLPVGWHRVFYEDAKLPIWDRQILVRSDQTAELNIPNNVRRGEGLLRVESLTFQEGRGLAATHFDSVFVDGQWAGLTPHEGRLKPGLHSVRVRSESGEVHTEMLDVHSGGTRYVVGQFGMNAHPQLIHRSPGRVELAGSLVLTMEIDTHGGDAVSRPTLHFPDLDSSVREVSLSQVDRSQPVFVGILDAGRISSRRNLRYYFTAESGTGDTVYSDLYTIRLKRPQKTPPVAAVMPPAAPAKINPRATTRPASIAATLPDPSPLSVDTPLVSNAARTVVVSGGVATATTVAEIAVTTGAEAPATNGAEAGAANAADAVGADVPEGSGPAEYLTRESIESDGTLSVSDQFGADTTTVPIGAIPVPSAPKRQIKIRQ